MAIFGRRGNGGVETREFPAFLNPPGAQLNQPGSGLPSYWDVSGQTPFTGGYSHGPTFLTYPSSLAAAETASGMLERAIGCAQVTAPPLAQPALTNHLLSVIARGMLFRGEQAVYLDTSRGRVDLWPCWHQFYDQREMWVDVAQPNGDFHIRTTLDSVALPHWSTDPLRWWRGVSPLENITSKVAANSAGLLNREATGKHGYAMPGRTRDNTPGAGFVKGAAAAVNQNIHATSGDTHALITSADLAVGQSPRKLMVQSRFGFDPPPQIKEIAEWASTQTLMACGIAPVLFSDNVEASREAQRRFIAYTAQPVADKIAAELGRVLEAEVKLDLSSSRTADDLASRARAVNSLTQAGMLLADALIEADLTNSEGRPAPNPPQTPAGAAVVAEDGAGSTL